MKYIEVTRLTVYFKNEPHHIFFDAFGQKDGTIYTVYSNSTKKKIREYKSNAVKRVEYSSDMRCIGE